MSYRHNLNQFNFAWLVYRIRPNNFRGSCLVQVLPISLRLVIENECVVDFTGCIENL